MLHALGITHVVSVGECALVPPPNIATSDSPGGYHLVAGRGPGGHGSLWMEEREGRIKVLDIKVRSQFTMSHLGRAVKTDAGERRESVTMASTVCNISWDQCVTGWNVLVRKEAKSWFTAASASRAVLPLRCVIGRSYLLRFTLSSFTLS